MTGPSMEAKREVWLLWDSDQLVTNIHPATWCSGECVVHNPSAHKMRHLPLSFDLMRKAFVRTCEHGATHQDPDERVYWTNQYLKAQAKTRTHKLAADRLDAWGCPECLCGCCWIGSGL